MKLTINIKNESKAKLFIKFLKEIPYVEIENSSKSEMANRKMKLPAEFFKPIKVDNYLNLNREEIYEDRIY